MYFQFRVYQTHPKIYNLIFAKLNMFKIFLEGHIYLETGHVKKGIQEEKKKQKKKVNEI